MTWASGPEADRDDEKTRLATAHPEWRIWETDGGELMATRRRTLSHDELEAGLNQTLPMGVFGDLAAQLREQDRLERKYGPAE